MYANARFHSIGTTSDFVTKFALKNMTEKSFEKIILKILIST